MDDIRNAAEALRVERPAYAKILDFHEEVFVAQAMSQKDIRLQPIEILPDVVSLKKREGFSLVTPESFQVDLTATQALLTKICRLVPEENRVLGTAADHLLDALNRDLVEMSELVGAVLDSGCSRLPKVAKKAGVDEAPLLFLLYSAMRPSIRVCARELSGRLRDQDAWEKGYCPVCGTAPALSLLKEDGHRFLLCGFCGHEWSSARIFCPFCENRDQKKLHYFFSEEEKGVRVDMCDTCHRYIKTVDTKEIKRPLFPLLENVCSLHLDMLAQEKGFESGLPKWRPM